MFYSIMMNKDVRDGDGNLIVIVNFHRLISHKFKFIQQYVQPK